MTTTALSTKLLTVPSAQVLKRAGRYTTISDNLRAKELIINQGSAAAERFIIVHNQKEAERDAIKRDDIVAETERRILELGDLTGRDHTKRVCALKANPTFGKYLREQKNGQLKLDKSKIATEAKLDGKYLIRTSDPYLSVEDVVLGYKQLFEIERVNRDLKHTIDVRPVYHRKEERIREHVLLAGWLFCSSGWRRPNRVIPGTSSNDSFVHYKPLITPPSRGSSRRPTS